MIRKKDMDYIICPDTACRVYVIVHRVSPDAALLDMMAHFMNGHRDQCPLEMLDQLQYGDEKPLVANGV